MSNEHRFGMRVAQLLDKTTIVIAGEGVETVIPGEELALLAVGAPIPGLSVPLIVQKGLVTAETVTKHYVVARSPEYEVQVETGLSALASMGLTRRVVRRDPLNVEETKLVGNPAWAPIAVGDPVVRKGDLSDYVEHLASGKT